MADIQWLRAYGPAIASWEDGAGAVSYRTPNSQRDQFYAWFEEVMANQLPASQPVRQMSGCVTSVRLEWSELRKQIAEADALDLIAGQQEIFEDSSYISAACTAAATAPDFTMTEEDSHAYQGLGSYSYDLTADYNEE